MSLTADRNTEMKDGDLIQVPVATNVVIFGGALVAANAGGYATPGAVATTLTCLGRAEGYVNNTGGANGAKNVMVRRRKMFKWKNYASDLVTQADLGKTCYIYDDETVAKTNGSATRSACGIVLGVDSTGVWVG